MQIRDCVCHIGSERRVRQALYTASLSSTWMTWTSCKSLLQKSSFQIQRSMDGLAAANQPRLYQRAGVKHALLLLPTWKHWHNEAGCRHWWHELGPAAPAYQDLSASSTCNLGDLVTGAWWHVFWMGAADWLPLRQPAVALAPLSPSCGLSSDCASTSKTVSMSAWHLDYSIYSRFCSAFFLSKSTRKLLRKNNIQIG